MKRKKLSSQIIAIFIVFLFVISAVGEASYLNVYAEETTEKATRLTYALCDEPLQSGIYYLDSSLTLDRNKYGQYDKAMAGITIAEGADVTIYVAAGCTLTCIGSDAYRSLYYSPYVHGYTILHESPAYAGIYVPEYSTLTLCGEGTVVAEGGDGTAQTGGLSGEAAGFAWVNIPFSDCKHVSVTRGRGGAGGMGASAPAAGIGGNAATGGKGGSVAGSWLGGDEVTDKGTISYGSAGNDGGTGGSGCGMGTLYVVDTITVNATAGTNNTDIAGIGDTAGSQTTTFQGMLILSAGGGGGANGGMAYDAADIGGAGASGGGGGGGGEGYGCSTDNSGGIGAAGTAGTRSNNHVGGNGGKSAEVRMSDGTVLVNGGGDGGGCGNAGRGGNLYVTSTATINGQKGTKCASVLNGASTYLSGTGQKAVVSACEKVNVDVTLDGDTGDWTETRDVALYQNDTRFKTLSNVILPDMTVISTYHTWIPTGQTYILYADDVCIGDKITTKTTETSLKAYIATATIKKDEVNWTGKRVDLYRSKLEYTLEDPDGDGVYTREIFETHTGKTGENEYRVYIDDIATDQNLLITSNSDSKDVYYYYTAEVKVESDGAPMSGQVASLAQNGDIIYNLAESATPGTYTKVIYKNKTDNEYDVYINAQVTGSTVDAGSLANLSATVRYYTASITLKKDDLPWSDASMALVDNAGNKVFLSGSNGTYTKMLAESQGDLHVYVYGSAGQADTGGVINKNNKTYSTDYYTISLDKNVSGSYIYSSEIVRSGDIPNAPSAPYANGQTFERWCADAAGTTDFDFSQPITGKTTIYASWQTPGVSIGTLVRCGADGGVDGAGEYYRMSNLNISGFPNTGNKITIVIFDYTNADFSNLNTVIPDTLASITVGDTRIIINFKEDQNVRDVEKLLRRLIIKPSYDVNSTIQATVYGYTN